MKLNYTSLQHAVAAGRGAATLAAAARRAPVARLPAARPARARSPGRSRRRGRGLRARLRADRRRRAARRRCRDTVPRAARARPARRPRHRRPGLRRRAGGDHDGRARSTTASPSEGWDAALVGPGPGILGSASALGHGGMRRARHRARRARARLPDAARRRACPRATRATRHRGLSHHTRDRARAAARRRVRRSRCPAERRRRSARRRAATTWRGVAAVDLDGYRAQRPARAHDGPRRSTRTRCSSPPRSPPAARWPSMVRGRPDEQTFERIGDETVLERPHRRRCASSASATTTARRSRARSSRHPGAVAIVAHDDEHVWLVRQPREIVRRAARCWRSPPASSTRPARTPLRRRASASWPRRSARRPSSWEHLEAILHEPRLHRRADRRLPRDGLRDAARRAVEEDERIEIVAWPLDRLDDAIAECHDAKSLIGLDVASTTPGAGVGGQPGGLARSSPRTRRARRSRGA